MTEQQYKQVQELLFRHKMNVLYQYTIDEILGELQQIFYERTGKKGNSPSRS